MKKLDSAIKYSAALIGAALAVLTGIAVKDIKKTKKTK